MFVCWSGFRCPETAYSDRKWFSLWAKWQSESANTMIITVCKVKGNLEASKCRHRITLSSMNRWTETLQYECIVPWGKDLEAHYRKNWTSRCGPLLHQKNTLFDRKVLLEWPPPLGLFKHELLMGLFLPPSSLFMNTGLNCKDKEMKKWICKDWEREKGWAEFPE